MKLFRLSLFVFLAFTAIGCQTESSEKEGKSEKKLSPYSEAKIQVNGVDISVNYSSPRTKGREIFGELVPYGEIWRTGADEASVFETSGDIMIEGKPLKKGKYALFTIPNKDQWTFIFNNEHEQWGAFNYDESLDELRVTAKPVSMNSVTENFSFFLLETSEKEGELKLAWDKLQVPLSFTVPQQKK